ncbi:MAG: DNA/RNA nuclease SfsA [Pseudomonadota bacterium]
MVTLPFPPLIEASWVERRKRFMLDVRLPDGTEFTAHCPNTGPMTGLPRPGAPVLLSVSDNPKRKYAHTLEAVKVDGIWVGANTQNPNRLMARLGAAHTPPFPPKGKVRAEVRYGKAERIDFLVENEGEPPLFVEIKNVHLVDHPGEASFPDCITTRGAKHLDALAHEVAAGNAAMLVYVIQRGDVDRFRLARHIDAAYGEAFDRAVAAGVRMVALCCNVSPEGIDVRGEIPILEPVLGAAA